MKQLAILLVLLVAGAGASVAASTREPDRTIVLTVRHSRFSPSQIHIRHSETVRFVVRNTDPIDHEFIVGPKATHDRHETGREATHPPVPGEVSVPLLDEASTTYEFADRGTVTFACHLPGHFAYGMTGRITVV